ncbi:hypothetical protein AJ80_06982 [Polytolypa hystricis UAMH7299]|uniref:Uncharacterized protein n=1 Tax=Polytolypa hystricis (strain UAMH7299) TaxID=1447883 RepID=A0A2B7XJB6_POLH7|nr:hypothetical protein AJ80_06982 [Polytolypa hystricis UAMH7299]
MPTLKQLTCHIEWANSGVPFKEYGVSYQDGLVESYIAVPPASTPFCINLKSGGYVAPGLAMFVFIDGVYQCNRNRDDLVAPECNDSIETATTKRMQTEVDFRVRQKEERLVGGGLVGRSWRFEPLKIIDNDSSTPIPKEDFANLGTIEVIVLRCAPRRPFNNGSRRKSVASDGSLTPRSCMSPTFPINEDDAMLSDESIEYESDGVMETVEDSNNNSGDAPGNNQETGGDGGSLALLFDGPYDGRGYYPNHEQQSYSGPQRRLSPPTNHGPNLRYGPQCECSECTHPDEMHAPPNHYPQNDDYHDWHRTEEVRPHIHHDHRNERFRYSHREEVHPQPTNIPRPVHTHDIYQHHNDSRNRWDTSIDPPTVLPRVRERPSHRAFSSSHPRTIRVERPPHNPRPSRHNIPPHVEIAGAPRDYRRVSGTYGDSTNTPQIVVPPIVLNINSPTPPRPEQPPQNNTHNGDVAAIDSPTSGSGCYIISDGRRISGKGAWKLGEALAFRRRNSNVSPDNGSPHSRKSSNGSRASDRSNRHSRPDNSARRGSPHNAWQNSQTHSRPGAHGPGDGEANDHNQSNGFWGNGRNARSAADEWANSTGNENNQNESDNNNDSDNVQTTYQNDTNGEQIGNEWSQPDSGNSGSQNQSSPDNNYDDNTQNEDQQQHANSDGQQAYPIYCGTFQYIPPAKSTEFVTPKSRDTASDEPPLYTVPAEIAAEASLSHQMQPGPQASYIHRIRRPLYLDSFEDPYARFVFKYRRPEIVQDKCSVIIEPDVDEEKKKLESLTKAELMDYLLRVHGLMDAQFIPPPPPILPSPTQSNGCQNTNGNSESFAAPTPAPARPEVRRPPSAPARVPGSNYQPPTVDNVPSEPGWNGRNHNPNTSAWPDQERRPMHGSSPHGENGRNNNPNTSDWPSQEPNQSRNNQQRDQDNRIGGFGGEQSSSQEETRGEQW